MTIAAAARVLAALSLACASSVRADERPAPAAAPATPAAPATTAAASGTAARDARPRAQDASRRPPPAVLVLPLIGLVLLPLTLPVADPRVRHAPAQGDARSPAAGGTAAANPTPAPTATATKATKATASAAPAVVAPLPAGERTAAREPVACPGCAEPRQPAVEPGARP
jgi:hypothetical protein